MKKNKRYIRLKIVEWAKAIIYALAILLLVQIFLFNKIHVTNSGMSPTISNGDYLLINKWNIGTRLPNSIAFTNIPLPTIRLPFGDTIKKFDIIAFNNPLDTLVPINQRDIYTKRVIGLPGETIQIKNGVLYVNQQQVLEPFDLKLPYSIHFHADASPSQVIRSIGEYEIYGPYKNNEYREHLSPVHLKLLKASKWVLAIKAIDWHQGLKAHTSINCKACDWDLDNFGPLYIPYHEDTLVLNEDRLEIHEELIKVHDHSHVTDSNTMIIADDYYFVLGDNRHNSIDSRFFGLVPSTHIIGKVNGVILNFDKANPYKSIQWDRFLKAIE